MPYTRSLARRYRSGSEPSRDNPQAITRFTAHHVLTVALTTLVFAVITMALARQAAEPRLVDVNLPIMASVQAAPMDTALVVTVTTTRPGRRGEGEFARQTLGTGNCLVYLDNDRPIDSTELYARAFDRLDLIGQWFLPGAEASAQQYAAPPTVQIRADASTPWRCIGGAIVNVEQAGYEVVSFLTHPVRP